MSDKDATVEKYVEEESNAAFVRGARHTAMFGVFGGVSVFALLACGLLAGVMVPGILSFVCAAYAVLVRSIARRGKLRGAWLYGLLIGFVSMPTMLFVVAHFTEAAGAATFITGPFSYVYILPIVVTGFMFDQRLSVLIGLIAAAEYFACYWLARPHLLELSGPDALQLQDLVSPPLYLLRASVLAGAGLTVGSLAAHARRLLVRVLHEEHEKHSIAKLFGTFVSPEVKDRIIARASTTIGERKRVAILFCDIRSFTTRSEGLEPEDLVAQLNEYFDRMVTAISRNGGTVDKFIGDAVMAVFGGVLDLERPCDNALDAAFAMRAALVDLNAVRAERGQPAIENGIGMHFGEVMQGPIGSADRKEFTVIGDAVNTASRIEAITKEHGLPIMVSGDFVAALREARRGACRRVGAVRLKGKTRDVDVYGAEDPSSDDTCSAGSRAAV